ncbi:hypothetical protein AB6A40_004476 [Gnathostoma spinigerum]|uniref:Uncharacterized protein n=1 Tax=Gnathostoma spinigerum TaxID=75299 RepID=A0ABD6EMH7_9BILA
MGSFTIILSIVIYIIAESCAPTKAQGSRTTTVPRYRREVDETFLCNRNLGNMVVAHITTNAAYSDSRRNTAVDSMIRSKTMNLLSEIHADLTGINDFSHEIKKKNGKVMLTYRFVNAVRRCNDFRAFGRFLTDSVPMITAVEVKCGCR